MFALLCIVMSMPFVSICVAVCRLAYLRNHTAVHHRILYIRGLHVAVAPSRSGGAAIRYVLPVLWVASCCHIMDQTTVMSHACLYSAVTDELRVCPLNDSHPST